MFDDQRYFDVFAEYAKADADDMLMRITVANRGPEAATVHLLPTLWFRNTWSWGRDGEGYWPKPSIRRSGPARMAAEHVGLGRYTLDGDVRTPALPELLFTDNETNLTRLFGVTECAAVREGRLPSGDRARATRSAVNPAGEGTKAAFHYVARPSPPAASAVVRLRLAEGDETPSAPFGQAFDQMFRERLAEADEFYAERVPDRRDGRGTAGAAAGIRRAAVEQAVLPLRDRRTGSRATRASRAPPTGRPRRAQRRLAARVQPRRHLDAGQVGVSLVRRLGPRLPHDPVRAHRSPLRQGAAAAAAARVVHASERPDSRPTSSPSAT